MSEIEMAVEALKKSVDPDAFAKAMREIQGGLLWSRVFRSLFPVS